MAWQFPGDFIDLNVWRKKVKGRLSLRPISGKYRAGKRREETYLCPRYVSINTMTEKMSLPLCATLIAFLTRKFFFTPIPPSPIAFAVSGWWVQVVTSSTFAAGMLMLHKVCYELCCGCNQTFFYYQSSMAWRAGETDLLGSKADQFWHDLSLNDWKLIAVLKNHIMQNARIWRIP